MEITKYSPEVSISSSRIVQESISVGQGVSAYGTLAEFIDTNIAQIDRLAEYIGDNISQKAVKKKYDEQYFKPDAEFKSFLNRNIYLNKNKAESMQKERLEYGFLTRLAAETALKYGARAVSVWANNKDKFIVCEQMYMILKSYIFNADANANKSKALTELNKIRNSFPLSLTEKKKLTEKCSNNLMIDNMNISSVLSANNTDVRNALAYFLTVLSRQLYGSESSSDSRILNYYSLLDLNGQYGKELCTENQYHYDEIASDQLAYLQMSRGIMKNMFIKSPSIDIDSIFARAEELSKYDPYAVRRKKIKGIAKSGTLTIGSIVSSNPEIALNGIATAISQFIKSDEVLSLARDSMLKWGISGNESDAIIDNSDNIILKNKESDIVI
ncbi:MAG: hypothetical protein SPE43_03965 [Ruminococcus sp.]|nr:hypothetical protein [Ruminococcus sp.]